jgi:DMSO/TMAO reductase YedYZ molybdopterin-dependent catalytic subunit
MSRSTWLPPYIRSLCSATKCTAGRLTREHGAPLRLSIPTKIGYKQAKYLTDLKVSHVLEKAGYWEDQGYSEFYGL